MIESIHYKNFKVLQDTTLPLSRFTLIVGPNGSGKSTAMQALSLFPAPGRNHFLDVVSAGLQRAGDAAVAITIDWALDIRSLDSKRKKIKQTDVVETIPSGMSIRYTAKWEHKGNAFTYEGPHIQTPGVSFEPNLTAQIIMNLSGFKIFSFDAQSISEPVTLRPNMQLASNGFGLAGVLDNLRDKEPERFEALNEELGRWMPEFDHILFETTDDGKRSFQLRTRIGKIPIRSSDLSHGSLFALAFLTLAYISNPPPIICFEEPERGIHPRLLREIRDGMYRLCYPEAYRDKRSPVQVIATSHSPYLLDLYKDHPEEIVIANKDENGAHFERLSDKPNIDEFLQDAPLGEVWYSGILGGVPNNP